MVKKVITLLVPLFVLSICGWAQFPTEISVTCNFQAIKIQQDSTWVYGINNAGAIVGTYNPTSGSQSGYVLKNGHVTNITWPGAAFTSGYGISDTGSVVGAYAMDLFSAEQGFSWTNGNFVNLTFPGSLATYATGININGQIVGSYQDGAGTFHGFLHSATGYVSIDYPGAQSTVVAQINNNGAMVGSFT